MMPQDYFREKKVYRYDYWSYPAVYWPDHPESWNNGIVHIHRVVAYEKYGGIPSGFDVHHIDGDPENWSADNLVLLEHGDHTSHHLGGGDKARRAILNCSNCGERLERLAASVPESGIVYCDYSCMGQDREVIDWPDDDYLRDLVQDVGYLAAASELGVSDNAIRKRLGTYTGS